MREVGERVETRSSQRADLQRIGSGGTRIEITRRLTVVALVRAINTQPRVTLGNLPTLHLREGLNRTQSTVLGQCQRDGIEGGSESAHGVLFNRSDVVGGLGNGDGASDFGGSSSVDDAVVADEVADDTECVVESALGLVDDLWCRHR